jgi:hypothetical protein
VETKNKNREKRTILRETSRGTKAILTPMRVNKRTLRLNKNSRSNCKKNSKKRVIKK